MTRRLLASALALFSLSAASVAQDQAYAFRNDLELVSIDLLTGNPVSAINARSGGMQFSNALTWNEDAQQLWCAEYNASNARIGILDPFTGSFTVRRLTAVPGWWMDMAWDRVSQRFYLVRQVVSGQAFLHVFNPANSTLLQVGELRNAAFPTALDTDGAGTLWLATAHAGIFTVDKSDADTAHVATLPLTIEGMGIHHATGRFYAHAAIQLTMYFMEIEPTVPSYRIIGFASSGVGRMDLVDGTCPGGFQVYGSGCRGFGGFVPELAGEGCLGAGGSVQLRVSRARAGTVGAILFGGGPGFVPIGNGCSLLLAPLFPAPVLPLSITGPGGFGNGFANVRLQLPTSIVIAPFAMQALLLDSGAPGGLSFTNGLAVLTPP